MAAGDGRTKLITMGDESGDRRARDADLTARAATGDRDAFDELFRLWFTPVWNVALGVLRDEDLAADVAQEAFLAAWRNLGTLRDPGSFGGWVLRIGRNRALNRLRTERRSAPFERETVAAIGDRADRRAGSGTGEPAHQAERRERHELVWAAAAVLGERDWLLLDLHLRHGLTPAELAGELGINTNNCHQILHRLRRRLGAVVAHYLLWQSRTRVCPTLQAVASVHREFDQAADQAIARHQAGCATCSAAAADLVRPDQLLATLPALLTPPDHLMAAAADSIRAVTGPEPAGSPSPTSSAIGRSVAGGPHPGRIGRRRRAIRAVTVAAVVLVGSAAALGIIRQHDPPGTALTATATGSVPPAEHPSGPSPSGPGATPGVTDPIPAAEEPLRATTDPAITTTTEGASTSAVPAASGPTATEPVIAPSTTVPTASSSSTTSSNSTTATSSSSTTSSNSTTATNRNTTSSSNSTTATSRDTTTTTSTTRGALITRPPPAPVVTDPAPESTPTEPPSVDARIAAGSGSCRTGSSWTVTWASDGTTSRLEVPGARPQSFDGDGGSGRATFCAPGGLTLRLTATGDGGTTVLTPVLPA